MGQYGINWRQLRNQPDHKGTVVFFKKDTGDTDIGKVTKDVLSEDVLAQVAFEQAIVSNWDYDIGEKPEAVLIGTLAFNKFLGTADTALYAEILLDKQYEPSLPLKFGVYYAMENTAANDGSDLVLNFDYLFVTEASTIPDATAYQDNPFTLTPTEDADLHVALNASIPAQEGSQVARDTLSLRFSRKADSNVGDENEDGICILSIFVYQEALA